MKHFKLFNATDAGSSVNSVAMPLGDLNRYSIEVEFAGAGNLNGTLSLETKINEASSWKTITGSSQAVVNSANHLWSVSDGEYDLVRVAWSYTSGTGSMTSYGILKENRTKEG